MGVYVLTTPVDMKIASDERVTTPVVNLGRITSEQNHRQEVQEVQEATPATPGAWATPDLLLSRLQPIDTRRPTPHYLPAMRRTPSGSHRSRTSEGVLLPGPSGHLVEQPAGPDAHRRIRRGRRRTERAAGTEAEITARHALCQRASPVR
jgi:hypothetical protein